MKLTTVILIPLLIIVTNTTPAQDASASSPQPNSSISTVQQPRLAQRSPRYRIRKSDSIDIQFALSPEFNQTASVQPDGYITLKAVGTIVAEGLTLPELTTAIHNAYAGTLHDPIVTIELKDFDKPYFMLQGRWPSPVNTICAATSHSPREWPLRVALLRPQSTLRWCCSGHRKTG